MRVWRNQLVFAVGFLTRLPMGRGLDPWPRLADAVWAFPLAGLVVALPGALILHFRPDALGAVLALALAIWLTRGLHEDGLADLADGIGMPDTARRLEVMRDSHIGSFGVLALMVAFALRVAALAALPMPSMGFLAAMVLARAGIGPLLLLPPARADGLGHMAGRPALRRIGFGLGLGLILCLPLLGLAKTVILLASVLLVQAALARVAIRAIGGQTGDVLGAAIVLGEAGGLLTLALIAG